MTLWRMRRDGKLPKPRKLGQKNVTPEDEADAAIAALIALLRRTCIAHSKSIFSFLFPQVILPCC